MFGILAGATRESETGEMLMQQLSSMSVGTCLMVSLLVYASLVPITKGAKMEPFGEGCCCSILFSCVIFLPRMRMHLMLAGV